MRVRAAASEAPATFTGVVFEPFQELKKDYLAVPIAQNVSLARQNFSDEAEAAINEQIKYGSFHSLTSYHLFLCCGVVFWLEFLRVKDLFFTLEKGSI